MASGAKQIPLSDAATTLRWSRQVGAESMWKTTWMNPKYGFMGKEGSGKPFINKTEFKDSIGGNKLTCILTGQVSEDGYGPGVNMDGVDASPSHFTETLEVYLLNSPPLAIESEQDQQHVSWDLAKDNRNKTSDWWAVTFDAGVGMVLHGATFTTAVDYYKPSGRLVRAGLINGIRQYTLCNASVVPTGTGREVWPNAITASENLTSADPLDLDLIDKMIDSAPQLKPPIRPAKWKGGEHYLFSLHQDHWTQLATDSRYKEIQVASLQGGLKPEDSVFYSGNLASYRNCTFLVNLWNPPAQNSSTAAGIANTRKFAMFGAEAMAFGWGQGHSQNRFTWHMESSNMGNVKRVNARSMFGGIKVQYNTKDYAVITGNTYALNVGEA